MGNIRDAVHRRWPSAWIVKTVGTPELAGLPDLQIVVAGRFVGLEVKKQGNGESQAEAYERTTILQRATIAKIRRAGGVGGVVLTVAEALELVDLALKDSAPGPAGKVVP